MDAGRRAPARDAGPRRRNEIRYHASATEVAMKPRLGLWALLLSSAPRLLSAAQPDPALQALIQETWEFRLREEPLLATSAGDQRYNDRIGSVASPDLDRRSAFARDMLGRLGRLDRARLGPADRIDYDVVRRWLDHEVKDHEFGAERIPINADSGFHSGFADLPRRVPLQTVKDYENYLARLRAFPGLVQQHIGHMREGLRTGFTQPRVVLEGYDETIRAHVVDAPEKSVFFAPFQSFPVGVPEADRARLREAGRQAVQQTVGGYRAFLDFFVGEYVPGARATTGASELPRGREYYADLVKFHTTLDVTPDQVHQTGLQEVARIRAEMEAVIKATGFQGDFAAFLKFLRTDPRFYPKTGEELLKEASYIAKRMDAKLPSLFKTLPRLPYGVEPVPDAI